MSENSVYKIFNNFFYISLSENPVYKIFNNFIYNSWPKNQVYKILKSGYCDDFMTCFLIKNFSISLL